MSATAEAPQATPLLTSRGVLAAVAFAAVAAVLVVVHLGVTGEGLVGAFLAAVLVVLAAVDLERRIIPNKIVGPAAVIVFVAQLVVHSGHVLEFVVAGVAAAVFLLVPALISPGSLGMGDVKLAFLLGLGLGKLVLTALVLGVFAGAAYAILLLVREGRDARSRAIPYGPFLAAGGIAALLLS